MHCFQDSVCTSESRVHCIDYIFLNFSGMNASGSMIIVYLYLKSYKKCRLQKNPQNAVCCYFSARFYVLFLSFLYIKKNLCYTLCNKNTKIVYVSLIWSYPTKQCPSKSSPDNRILHTRVTYLQKSCTRP